MACFRWHWVARNEGNEGRALVAWFGLVGEREKGGPAMAMPCGGERGGPRRSAPAGVPGRHHRLGCGGTGQSACNTGNNARGQGAVGGPETMHVAGSGRWVRNNVLRAGESCTCVGPEKKKGKKRKEKGEWV
jgi:hypothetical protein